MSKMNWGSVIFFPKREIIDVADKNYQKKVDKKDEFGAPPDAYDESGNSLPGLIFVGKKEKEQTK